MNKQWLLYELRAKKRELKARLEDKKVLDEKLETLDEFAGECASHVASFDSSISRRRQRLSGVGSLFSRARTAMLYSQKMGEALSGQDYTKTVASIDALRASVSAKRKTVADDLLDTEKEIGRLRQEIARLQYEYDHFPEEDEKDG